MSGVLQYNMYIYIYILYNMWVCFQMGCALQMAIYSGEFHMESWLEIHGKQRGTFRLTYMGGFTNGDTKDTHNNKAVL